MKHNEYESVTERLNRLLELIDSGFKLADYLDEQIGGNNEIYRSFVHRLYEQTKNIKSITERNLDGIDEIAFTENMFEKRIKDLTFSRDYFKKQVAARKKLEAE